jgi:hypothetical protein
MLKRLLLGTLLLFLFSTSVFATDITISSFTIESSQLTGSTYTLRIWYSRTFVDSLGNVVAGGSGTSNFYKGVLCTNNTSTHIVTCPSFVLRSTVDSSDPDTTISAALYDSGGSKKLDVFGGWSLPATNGTTLAFSTFKTLNTEPPVYPPPGYPNNDQVQQWINTAVGTLNDASDVIKGRVKLSVAPVSPSNPIAVGDNDSRLIQSIQNVATAFNVKKNGAAGDSNLSGTGTDDTAAIQATINAAVSAGRGKVYLPHGMYLVSSGLTTTKPIKGKIRILF